MDKNILDKKSRKMSQLLRHDPKPLTMDDKGWVDSGELCKYLDISMEGLEWIVDNNDKKRFVFSDDKTQIRAAQGHSKGVADDKDYARITAMQEELELYHGTDDVTAEFIKNDKILSGNRQFVHWSADIQTATKRARQRAFHNRTNPVIIVLKARNYIHGNGKLMMAENDVYLTPEIDGKILEYRPI
jgi:putative RNA 2'-phosphotransferase